MPHYDSKSPHGVLTPKDLPGEALVTSRDRLIGGGSRLSRILVCSIFFAQDFLDHVKFDGLVTRSSAHQLYHAQILRPRFQC